MKKYFIVTGASKGLGLAFAEYLLHPDHVLFLIARSLNPDISGKAMMKNCRVHSISFDLSDTENISKLMCNIFDHINDDCGAFYLINNAGIVEPVMPIEKAEAGAIEKIIQVNYMAPVLLVSNFIRLAANIGLPGFVLNITSGAASNPHAGMSMYSSTKAALDMFTKSVALEQENRENPMHIHAISPGFVDTDMPNRLLEKDPADFESVEKFKTSKRKGKFGETKMVAEKIIKLWFEGRLKHGEVSHLQDF